MHSPLLSPRFFQSFSSSIPSLSSSSFSSLPLIPSSSYSLSLPSLRINPHLTRTQRQRTTCDLARPIRRLHTHSKRAHTRDAAPRSIRTHGCYSFLRILRSSLRGCGCAGGEIECTINFSVSFGFLLIGMVLLKEGHTYQVAIASLSPDAAVMQVL